MPKRMPHSRITGPATRSGLRAAALSEGELRHPQVARLSRDTYLPAALRDDLTGRLAAVLLAGPVRVPPRAGEEEGGRGPPS